VEQFYDYYRILVFCPHNGMHYDISNVLDVMALNLQEGTILSIQGLGVLELTEIIDSDFFYKESGSLVYEEEWVCELIN